MSGIDPKSLDNSLTKAIDSYNSNPFLGDTYKTQDFGAKTFWFYGNQGHEGVDFHATIGTPLTGPAGWVVDDVNNSNQGAYGKKLVLKNPKTGEILEFTHLDNVIAKPGDVVQPGQVLAKTGNSGVVPGTNEPQQAHLHVNYVDPKGNLADVTKASFFNANNQAINNTPDVNYSPQTAANKSIVLPETGGPSYQIKSGDTLSGLARQFGTTVADFQKANPYITNPNKIYAGKSLVIPNTSPSTPVTKPWVETRTANSQTQTVGRGYNIAPGDTLSGIARKLGTTVGDLQKKNNIANPNLIYAGSVLRY